MKKITITLLVLLIGNSAFADLKWTRGPFWKTVYEDRFSIELQNTNKEISAECTFFENYIRDSEGNFTAIDGEDFKFIDSMSLPSDMTNDEFQIDFKVLIPLSLTVATGLQDRSDIAALINSESALDVLPNYTQVPSEIRLLPSAFQNTPNINKKPQGLTARGAQLQVSIKPPKFVRLGGETFLRVSNKSLACDLLSGQASLILSAQAHVKITLDSQIKLQTTYADIEKTSLDLIAKTKNPKVRAAIFGFRISELLQREKNDTTEKTENRMIALLDQLFDSENMNPSAVWQDGIGQKNLTVSGTSAAVDVQVELHAHGKE